MSNYAQAQPEVLFIFLEFPDWRLARSLGYPTQVGMERALRDSGARVTSIPASYGMTNNDRANWMSRIKELVGPRTFDQVWIELVHADYDEAFFSWIEGLAPVRLGFVMESLQYEPYVYELEPQLKARKERVLHRMRHVTHILLADEADATDLAGDSRVRASWWPQTVPAASITHVPPPVVNDYAVFYGALYGKREGWLRHADLEGLLVQPGPSLEYQTEAPALFDRLQLTTRQALENGLVAAPYQLERYVSVLANLRGKIFAMWLDSLRQGCAVVNLPSYFQGFPGRVYEGMAAGRPVISCTVPGRPRTNALFTDSEDILLYDPESPAELGRQIRRLQTDRGLARKLVDNASRKLAQLHTAEIRVSQIRRWLEDGREPDFHVA